MKDTVKVRFFRLAATKPTGLGSSVFAAVSEEADCDALATMLRADGYEVRVVPETMEIPARKVVADA